MDHLQPLNPGDKFQPSATWYNHTLALIKDRLRGTPSGAAESADSQPIYIRNDSGRDLQMFAVVGIGDPVITPPTTPYVYSADEIEALEAEAVELEAEAVTARSEFEAAESDPDFEGTTANLESLADAADLAAERARHKADIASGEEETPTPSQNDERFKFNVVFKSAPVMTDGAFAILQTPTLQDGLGQMMAAGTTWVLIKDRAPTHKYAVPIANDYEKLQSQGSSGAARILWKETITPNEWDDETAYKVNNSVTRFSIAYTCIADHANQEPPNATYWTAGITLWAYVSFNGAQEREWDFVKIVSNNSAHDAINQFHFGVVMDLDADGNYSEVSDSDVFVSNITPAIDDYPVLGKTYIGHNLGTKYALWAVSKLSNNTNRGLRNTTYWLRAGLTESPQEAAAWSAVFAYSFGNLATFGGTTYICKLASLNNQPPNATYWIPLTTNEGEYASDKMYSVGQYVVQYLDSYGIEDWPTTQATLWFTTDRTGAENFTVMAATLAQRPSGATDAGNFEITARPPGLTGSGTVTLVPPTFTPGAPDTLLTSTLLKVTGRSYPDLVTDTAPAFGVGTFVGGYVVTGGLTFKGGLYISGTITATGTVTSIDVSGGTTGLTTSGGPVTGSGTITIAGTLALANGGTGAVLADPNADRIMFWDDSAGQVTWLTAGTGLTITGTTIASTGSGITGTGTDNHIMRWDGTGAAQDTLLVIADAATQISTAAAQAFMGVGEDGSNRGSAWFQALDYTGDDYLYDFIVQGGYGIIIRQSQNAAYINPIITITGAGGSSNVAATATVAGSTFVSGFYTGGTSTAVTAASAFGTDNRLVRVDGTGRGTQASGITIDDSDNVTGVVNLTATGSIDLSGATELKIPVSATPTVNANGEIALDTSVTDWSHGIVRIYGGEELCLLAAPVAILSSPTSNGIFRYNASNDEIELASPTSIATSVLAEDAMPIGTILLRPALFPGGTTTKWLRLNGDSVSRTTYSVLFDLWNPTITGDTTNTSTTVNGIVASWTFSSAAGTSDPSGYIVVGSGIPAATVVSSINSGTSIEISNAATATASGVSLRLFPFGIGDGSTTWQLPTVPSENSYLHYYVKALA